jgi:hypothetical protein
MAKLPQPHRPDHTYTPPLRYWRWLWLSYALWVLAALIFCVIIVPYWLAKGIVKGGDWFGSLVASARIRLLNRDRQRAINGGYIFTEPRAPAPLLAERWRSHLEKDS